MTAPGEPLYYSVASALVAAARQRWPGIHITEGVTPAGEALYDSLANDQGA